MLGRIFGRRRQIPRKQNAALLELAPKIGFWAQISTKAGWQKLRHAYHLRRKRQLLLLRAWRKSFQLRVVVKRLDHITPDMILAVMVLRNEAARLPYFMAHYRNLGVGHFLIIDNGSDDDSLAYLRAQPDVSLWQTDASYRHARFGVDWQNWILSRHGHGHWCLSLDADELLIYPHHDTRPLTALTEWLDQHNAPSLPAFMLELYPEGRLDQGQYLPGQDPTHHLAWFDSGNYSLQVQPDLRNIWLQGGPRARAYFAQDPARAPTLNKVPLVKWHWRYAYLNSTHSLLPARLNDVFDETGGIAISGALLHTKFLPGIRERSAEERLRRQHFTEPSRFGDYYDALEDARPLKCSHSTKYRGWRHLEALGLISRGGWL